MATGRLGAADLSATTYTTVYTVPASTFSVVTINLCNRNATSVTVRIAITTTGGPAAPSSSEFIEYDSTLVANGVLERTGIVMDAGKIVSVYTTTGSVSATVFGIETSTS